jgi:hypothetical protein
VSAFVFRVCATFAVLMLPAVALAQDTATDPARAIPLPRAKPAAEAAPLAPPVTPQPRQKPATVPTPVPRPVTAAAPAPEPQQIPLPTEAQVKAGMLPCGEACGDILFKTIDGCLWVQSQNPKPITFQARVDGRLVELALEGASYDKSAGTSAAPAQGISAYHTRQKDPFQSSSAGIPVYRARLGDKSGCATSRAQISQFVAIFRQ